MFLFILAATLKSQPQNHYMNIMEVNNADTGKIGDITYSFSNGILTFSGAEYFPIESFQPPWYAYSSNIKEIIIENGLKSFDPRIDKKLCYDHLTKISIPESITYFSLYGFHNSPALSSIVLDENNQGYTIHNGALYSKNYDELINVPSMVSTNFVFHESCTTIRSYAFSCCRLETLVIPNHIKHINEESFPYSINLISVTIPDNIEHIYGIFKYATSLKSVTLSQNILEIHESSFYECINLTSITLHDKLTYISDKVFFSCVSLTSITIPENVNFIGNNCFAYCTSLKTVTLPNGLKSIENYAFSDCISLESIKWPVGETIISEGCFCNCQKLASIDIPTTVTEFRRISFSDCISLSSISFPSGTTLIGTQSFSNCISLTSITINAIEIDSYAFEKCMNLTKVTITSSVAKINKSPFFKCSKLVSIDVSENNNDYASYSGSLYSKDLSMLHEVPYGIKGQLTINKNTLSIGDYALKNCEFITNVILPDSVTYIGVSAFEECLMLSSIKLPRDLVSISDSAFINCENLASIQFNDKLVSIGKSAFSSCKKLYSVTIPNSVLELGKSVFYQSGLHYAILSENLNNISDSAFQECYKLNYIIIPDNIITIGQNAFYNCANLSYVVIGKSTTKIGHNAFYCHQDYKNHVKLYYIGINEPELENNLYGYNIDVLVTSEYNSDSFGDLIFSKTLIYGKFGSNNMWLFDKKESNLTILASEELENYSSSLETPWNSLITTVKHIYFTNTLKSIGNHSFSLCPKLSNLKLSNSIQYIGSFAFYNCTNLRGKLDFPESIEYIGESAFENTEILIITYYGLVEPNCNNAFFKEGSNYSIDPWIKAYKIPTFCGFQIKKSLQILVLLILQKVQQKKSYMIFYVIHFMKKVIE